MPPQALRALARVAIVEQREGSRRACGDRTRCRWNRIDDQIQELSTGGTVLGLFSQPSYEEATIDLRPGDTVIAFTDGVTEALNPNEEEFGEEGLKSLLRQVVHSPIDEISSRVSNELRNWIQDALQHDCARSGDGRFVVKRRTDRKRLTRKLHTVRTEQRRRMHAPLSDQHRWLYSVLRGHYRYYGLPNNWHALDGFYDEVRRGWFRALRRRSHRGLTWDRFNQWLARFPLPRARIFHTREALAG